MRCFIKTCLTLLAIGLLNSTAWAQGKVTPDEVFRVTEDIIAQLQRMHQANFTGPDYSKVKLDFPTRLPRHALQQALNVRLKINVLKRINGLEQVALTPPPVQEVTPSDVLDVTNTILNDLGAFDAIYKLPPLEKAAPMPEGKTPSDVYANLLRIEEMVMQLGIPSTVPNDVYNVAVSLIKEVEYLRGAMGKTQTVTPANGAQDKNRFQIYDLSYEALERLNTLSQRPEYNIPEGVIMPAKLTDNIVAGDVLQLLLFCLAELSSMKAKEGVNEPLTFLEPTAGQTPSSVFDKLETVNRLIATL